jgi:hypothetical protein
MWNSITNQWSSSSQPSYNLNRVQQNEEPIDFILNEHSARDSTPKDCAIKLWPHQEAMLHRIRTIENTNYLCKTEHAEASFARYMFKRDAPKAEMVCLGVMNDPPGSGKTYAILSHILSDNNKGPSIIIVPQNIYAQWRESIEKVFKNNLQSCLFSMSYADVMNIYGNSQQVNAYKVILLQDSFAEAYLKVLNDNSIGVCRVVIDEVDIMDKFVCSSVKTKFVWLMSASYKDQTRLGPYHIDNHRQVICKCDDGFVKKSLNLPDPVNRIIKCDDEHIMVFNGILNSNEMRALHAGDLNIINRLMNKSGLVMSTTIKNTIKDYSDYLLRKSDGLDEAKLELEKLIVIQDDNGRSAKERNLLIDKINQLERFREDSKTLLKRMEELPDLSTLAFKENNVKTEFVDKMLEDKQSKWLIFNDNTNVLIKVQSYLQTKNIKCEMLDGGNQKLIEKTLQNYKEGDVQVLLLNSMIEGAGMNLENTTHLVFMHKTQQKFVEQVIGRAQRYGRKAPLNIIMLFNNHE